jgi:pimeloyl-ACP methyl ester carboxylesterase
MKERTVLIGEDPALVGIVTEPGSASDVECRPACLLLNAGLVHRVGPNRLHVRLARELAAAGFRACRFDLSGRGDSEVRRDGLPFLESSVAEIRTVMDYLGKTGSRRFVLMGICSGAVNALQLAAVDPRVAGCVAIDGPAYPTRRYYLEEHVCRPERDRPLAARGRGAGGTCGRGRIRQSVRGSEGPGQGSRGNRAQRHPGPGRTAVFRVHGLVVHLQLPGPTRRRVSFRP